MKTVPRAFHQGRIHTPTIQKYISMSQEMFHGEVFPIFCSGSFEAAPVKHLCLCMLLGIWHEADPKQSPFCTN